MGAVYEEFERELKKLETACAGDPRREMITLFLLALEREELVTVGYRESLMDARLSAMPISPELRELVRHVLIWIWKDEEMHTIYIRGAILKLGSPWLKLQAFATQAAGGLGGWAGSVLQHSTWRRAPFSRLIATLVTFAGGLVGKVPRDVRQHLEFGPFRNFCTFNIDAERTAAVCWRRIADLAAALPDFDPGLGRDFRRVAEDEDRHGALFAILEEVLTPSDTLAEGVSIADLVERVRAVGEEFLPRMYRTRSDLENPIGSGQPVYVFEAQDGPIPLAPASAAKQRERVAEGRVRGRGPSDIDRGASEEISPAELSDKRTLFRRLLETSPLATAIRERATFLDRSVDTLTVAIKPSFMLGYDRCDPSPLTDVELLADLAAYLREVGCRDVAVIEGRNIYDRFFAHRTVQEVAAYFGYASPHYRVVDTADEQVEHRYRRGMAQYTIAQSWRDADFRISFPKIRSHPIELALLSVGNVEWVGGRCDEYLFLERQADRATANMMLLDEFPPHFAILDGYENAPDGLVGVMGCERPKHLRRFYAGRDALAVDTIALAHLGEQDPQRGSILRTARHWFSGSKQPIEVIGPNTPLLDWQGPYSSELRSLLSMLAYPMYTVGSRRGELFVPEMDPAAFPAIVKEGWLLRQRRRAVRWLLGLRRPHVKAERKS